MMRLLAVALAAIGAIALANCNPGTVALSGQAPVGVASVAVRVLDGQGTPVGDLRAEEFQIEIDGERRALVSADPIAPGEPPARERRFLFVPDLLHLEAGQASPVLAVAKGLLGSLHDQDRVALVPIPEGRPRLDFTTGHATVAQALPGLQGYGRPPAGRRFTIDIAEAFAIVREGRSSQIYQQVVERECQDPERCEVEDEARAMVREALGNTRSSLRALQGVLAAHASSGGEQSALVLSDGLLYDPSLLEDFARVDQAAAAARFSIWVLAPDVPGGAARRGRLSGTGAYADLGLEGLRVIAEHNGGFVYRPVGGTQGVIDRLGKEWTSGYRLMFEPAPRDRDGRPHRLRVTVARQGLVVRSRTTFVAQAQP
jgi:VWFA-related protein